MQSGIICEQLFLLYHMRPEGLLYDAVSAEREILAIAKFFSVLSRSAMQLNPLDYKGNYSATSNNTKLVHWPYRWVGCYIWYSEEGHGRAAAPPSRLLAVPNVTAHPSTASVPIIVLLMVRCSAVLMWRLKS